MSEETPLHVRVAEALGWTETGEMQSATAHRIWVGTTPGRQTWLLEIPRYDTDWSATGPLIEKYGICLWNEYGGAGDWEAGRGSSADYEGMFFAQESEKGSTPLIAVCNLILALHAAGKLDVS